MAKVQETESSFEGVPPGEYIGFYAGFVPRDEDTMRPRIIEVDEWKDNQKTGNKMPAILWRFGIVYPEAHAGGEATGKANWKGLRVVQNEAGENILQIDRVGNWIANLIRWSEVCGVDWKADFERSLPDTGAITEQMIVEALDAALLRHAREGVLVVIKVGERGYVDTRDHNSDCVMPLPAGPAAKKVEGVQYTVPDFYGAGMGTVAGSWSDEGLEAMRTHIRDVLHPALTVGTNVLGLADANERKWLAQAIQSGGADYGQRAAIFAKCMLEGGFDAVETNLLVRVVSMVTGAPVAGKIVDSLAPPQLDSAVRCLADLARALGKEIPDAPMPPAPKDEWGDSEIPF
jgi:hypothetical protein